MTKVTFRDNGNGITKVVAYSYDAFNRWIGKTVDNDGDTDVDRSEAYVYDGKQIVLRFADNTDMPLDDNSLSNRYLWGPAVDQLLADEQVTSLGSAGNVLWAAGDHQNTIRDWLEYDSGLDETTVVDHAQYDSFGNRINTPTEDAFFGYTGRAFDADTGLQNNWHRWYDNTTGRWISEDPISFLGYDSNLYRYANNHPGLSIDPSGLAELKITPEKADSMPWEKKNLGNNPRQVGRTTTGKKKFDYTLVPVKDCDGKETGVKVVFKIEIEIHIYLDVDKIDKVIADQKIPGFTRETVYGHEQRHVNSIIEGAQMIKNKLTQAETAYGVHSRDEASEWASQKSLDAYNAFEEWNTDEQNHANRNSPQNGTPYPPLGTMPKEPSNANPPKPNNPKPNQ